MKKTIFFFGIITFLSVLIRFWNYQENINFHLDPPLFMHEVKEMVDSGKIGLIGPMVTSKMMEGRGFFTGPTMYYLLILLGLITNWNIEIITAFFGLLWLVFFILLYLWLKKKFGTTISLLIYGLVSFFPWFVPHARIIWNPTFIPLFALFLMYFLEKREGKKLSYFLAGLSFGLGLSIEYIALLMFPFIIYYLVWESRHNSFRIINWFFVAVGIVAGEAPFIIFELRHNFYNLQTILFHLKYYRSDPTYSFEFPGHSYYYIFPFLPFYCLILGKIFKKIEEKFGQKLLVFFQLPIIFLFLVRLILGPRDEALINPKGWEIPRQKAAANLIIRDNPKIFEVASLMGPDTRAMELRWWLRMAGFQPMGVEDYNKTDLLYLVGPLSRLPEKETVWEVKSLRPFSIEKTVDLGDNIFFYKLVRQKDERI